MNNIIKKSVNDVHMGILNCAVIGCGRIGCGFDDNQQDKKVCTHAGSYFINPKTRLIALCDVDKNKLQKYGKKYDVEGLYTNSTDLFKNELLDCVSICTLVDSHLELVTKAATSGVKGIFVEKPISSSLNDAKKIIQICEKNNIVLAVDYQRRFDPFYHSIKNVLSNNTLGEIQEVNVYYGGGLANTGSHMFDLLRYFFGDVASIKSNISKNKSANPKDPNVDAILEFNNHVQCKITALDYRNYVIFEMDILGTIGRLRINLVNNTCDLQTTSSGHNIAGYNTLQPLKFKINKSTESAISLAIKNLTDSIKYNKKPLCTGHDGYKSLELIIAAKKSLEKNQLIHLPIKDYDYKISSK